MIHGILLQLKEIFNMKKKTNVMLITHDLAIGGLQQVVVNICNRIDKNKFNVKVMCLRNLGEYTDEINRLGIQIYYLPHKKSISDYFKFLFVAKILRKEKIKVIHTHNTQPFLDGTLGAILSGVKTIIHTDHARNFPDKKKYMIAERILSKFAFKVVGVSEHTCKNLNKYEKISKGKIAVINNGILYEKYNIKINNKKKKEQLSIKTDGYIIGLCVRLSNQKGITYLLRAMPKIINMYPDILLLIAGDGKRRKNLEEESINLNIEKNVKFLGGRVDIPEILQLLTLYTLPSLWEGMPMALLEAMAAGVPIVTTNVGGIPKMIKHGFNGLIVDPQNHEKLGDAILKLLDDRKLREKFIENGKKTFLDNYDASIMTKKYEVLYNRTDN